MFFRSWISPNVVGLGGLGVIVGGACIPATNVAAQSATKAAIVEIVTTGVRVSGGVAERFKYIGSGFIIHTELSAGGAQTVILTADHVLGYSKVKNDLGYGFGAEVRHMPPVWIQRDHRECPEDLRQASGGLAESAPCRQIEVYYYDVDTGSWRPYSSPVREHYIGNKNQDFAVLWVKHFHNKLKPLELGHGSSLTEGGIRSGRDLPSVQAWGVDASYPSNDAYSTSLAYRSRDVGPTIKLQNAVKSGNSGGPVIFDGKVVGIVSAVEGDETLVTPIQTTYNALTNWNIQSLRNVVSPSITNARKFIATSDYGTAHRMLEQVWEKQKDPEAARLLARINFEKLGNTENAMKWLRNLAATGDRRARLELVLLAHTAAEQAITDADSRAARGTDTAAPVSTAVALSRLASGSNSDPEALYACSFLFATTEMESTKDLPADGACSKSVVERTASLEKSADPVLALVQMAREQIRRKETLPESLTVAAIGGRFYAALAVLESIRIANDSELQLFTKLSEQIAKRKLDASRLYVVSDPLFRILDDYPTRAELARANLLVALAHLTGRTKAAPKQQLVQAREFSERAVTLMKAEGTTGDSSQFPYRLHYLVKALLEERDGSAREAGRYAMSTLPEWDSDPYLPYFASELNVFDVALRIAIKADDASTRATISKYLVESCNSAKCWQPLTRRFEEGIQAIGQDFAKNVYIALETMAFTENDLNTFQADSEDQAGAGSLAAAIINRRVFAPDSRPGKRLGQIVALFSEGKPESCSSNSCGEEKIWVTLGSWRDWELQEARSQASHQVSCRIQTTAGLFRQTPGEVGEAVPRLSLSATEKSWTRQVLAYFPGYKVSDQAMAGDKVPKFFVWEKDFSVAILNRKADGYLYLDSDRPEYRELMDSLSKGHNISISYRRAGGRTITREHLSLYGFSEAYRAMLNRCKSMNSFLQ